MRVLPLFSAMIALLDYRAAVRREKGVNPGQVVREELGATFGKVVGIEEAIAENAVQANTVRVAREALFDSRISDDRFAQDAIEKVVAGAIVSVRSAEFGEETYGIDTSVGDETRISSISPLALALISHRIGERITVRGITYEITAIKSSGGQRAVESLIQRFMEEISTEAAKVLASNPETYGQAQQRHAVAVANLLDRIQLLPILMEVYGVTVDTRMIANLQAQLEIQPHVPLDDIRESVGYRHLMEEFQRNKPR